jgi:prepilin-type N-terminal cleavage/methylation domain-containing protein
MSQTVNNSKRGFTLIEIMVAVSIFAIVATIIVGALLAANAANQKAQAIKLAIDNVNYAIDSMVIKMKRGAVYNCAGVVGSPVNCTNTPGTSIAFISPKDPLPGYSATPYTYKLASGRITLNDVPITSQDVTIESLKFWVYDTDKSAGRIVMTVVGNARVGKQTSYFALETAVAER